MEVNNVQDYAKKIDMETKKNKRITIILVSIFSIFAFCFGFYVSYRYLEINKKEQVQLNKFNEIYNTILDEWYYGIDDDNLDETLIENAIKGMVNNDGDMFTRYVTSIEHLQTSSSGIGIVVSEYGEYFYINDVVNNKIKDVIFVGDILKEIDGNSLSYKDAEYVKSLLVNKTKVSLLILRNGEDVLIENVEIGEYNLLTVFGENEIGANTSYVRISEFAENTALDLDKFLKTNTASNLIIDLRDNPGGYITSVVDVADLFLGKNKVVLETKDKKGNSVYYKTYDEDYYDFDKIVILINEMSASGAEALSAALNEQLDEKVVLYGKTTYGKGSAQKTLSLGKNDYLVYTYALWYTPKGNSINKVGVDAEVIYSYEGLYSSGYTTQELEMDDLGDEVKKLQDSLKKLGYHAGEWSYYGYYSDEVFNAVKLFQTDKGIPVTGEYDLITLRSMLAVVKDSQVDSYEAQVEYVLNNIANFGE